MQGADESVVSDFGYSRPEPDVACELPGTVGMFGESIYCKKLAFEARPCERMYSIEGIVGRSCDKETGSIADCSLL
jgi:hypothetical protein